MERGIYIGLLAVMLWGAFNATTRNLFVVYDLNVWAFALLHMFVAGVFLTVTGFQSHNKRKAFQTLKNGYTWAYGFLRLCAVILFMFALKGMSATEATFINCINVVMSLFVGYFMFGRTPKLSQLPLYVLVIASVTGLVLLQPQGFANPYVIVLLSSSVLFAYMTGLMEKHPEAQTSIGFRGRSLFTGIVMLVTSLIMFVAVICFSFAPVPNIPVVADVMKGLPNLEMFMRKELWIASILVGLFLRAPAFYGSLLSLRLLKTENYMLVLTFIPFSTLLFESLFELFSPHAAISFSLDWKVVLAGSIITFSSIMLILSKYIAKSKA